MKNLVLITFALIALSCQKENITPEPEADGAITTVEFNGQMIEVGRSYPQGTFKQFEEIAGITSAVGGWYEGWPNDLGRNSWVVVYTFNECDTCTDNMGMNLNGWQSGWTPLNFADPGVSPYLEMPFDYSYSGVNLDAIDMVCDTTNSYHRYQVTSENQDVRVQVYFFSAYLDKYDRPLYAIVDIDSHNVNMGDGDVFEFYAFSDEEPAANQSFFGNECALTGPTLIR